MTLTFNSHLQADTIYVAFVHYDDRCEELFRKRGWYAVGPGGSADVWNGDCARVNDLWYFYAESAGGLVWSGSAAFIPIGPAAFSQSVWDDADTDRDVGLIEVELAGSRDCTINLWGPEGAKLYRRS
jgi:hypothetical protein